MDKKAMKKLSYVLNGLRKAEEKGKGLNQEEVDKLIRRANKKF